jgi:Zn-dependent peptidase ImmA (M78 family)
MSLKAYINKESLLKIVKSMKVSEEFLAKASSCKDIKIVRNWLNPTAPMLPTFKQAEKIVKKLKIPLGNLYLKPEYLENIKFPIITNFRSLENKVNDESELNIAILDLLNNRDYFINIKEELDEHIPNFEVFIDNKLTVTAMANEIRDKFEINLKERYNLSDSRHLYLYLRDKIEKKGIFIQNFTGIDVKMVRGIALYYSRLPIIGINDNDSHSAKSFSIIHELVHIIKRQSANCNNFFDSDRNDKEEIFCNAVAGEFLVPENDLNEYLIKKGNSLFSEKYIPSYDDIKSLAQNFLVSKQVIARRLYDTQNFTKEEYNKFLEHNKFKNKTKKNINNKEINKSSAKSVSTLYKKAFDRISTHLSNAFLRELENDDINITDFCQKIGLNQKCTDKFIEELLIWRK